MQKGAMLLALVMVGVLVDGVWGHGMMMEPIQRSSMWRDSERFPFATPNYNDNELFCGGFQHQWERNKGKCGTCGDPYDTPHPRPNEAGGEFARGIIVATYPQGAIINVTIRITANHRGYFVFKLCPNNNVTKRATQECLDRYVLKSGESDDELADKFYIGSFRGDKELRLRLPTDVTCTQCVLQWTYNTGNSWGCWPNKTCCIGCGPQENFVNCADIAITPSGDASPVSDAPTARRSSTSSMAPSTMALSAMAPSSMAPSTTTNSHPRRDVDQTGESCRAVPPYHTVPGMDNWCNVSCAADNCPSSHCICP